MSHRSRVIGIALACVTVVLLAGSAGATGHSGASAEASTVKPNACGSVPKFHSAHFPAVPVIDNKWMPLVPGTQFSLDGIVIDAGHNHKHRILSTVSEMTKVVDGVRTIVIWERDFQDGKLQESELFFTAQDTSGAEWLLGEFPALYEKGRFAGAPDTWIGGTAGSKPGISIQAKPALGTPGYRQGWAPSVGFFDCAKVHAVNQRNTVPAGSFSDVLVTDEWGPLDPASGHQRKYYAPGVGSIRVAAVGGDSREDLVLTKITRLCQPGDLARVRAAVRKLEGHAYRTNKAYGTTAPAQYTLHAEPCHG